MDVEEIKGYLKCRKFCTKIEVERRKRLRKKSSLIYLLLLRMMTVTEKFEAFQLAKLSSDCSWNFLLSNEYLLITIAKEWQRKARLSLRNFRAKMLLTSRHRLVSMNLIPRGKENVFLSAVSIELLLLQFCIFSFSSTKAQRARAHFLTFRISAHLSPQPEEEKNSMFEKQFHESLRACTTEFPPMP